VTGGSVSPSLFAPPLYPSLADAGRREREKLFIQRLLQLHALFSQCTPPWLALLSISASSLLLSLSLSLSLSLALCLSLSWLLVSNFYDTHTHDPKPSRMTASRRRASLCNVNQKEAVSHFNGFSLARFPISLVPSPSVRQATGYESLSGGKRRENLKDRKKQQWMDED